MGKDDKLLPERVSRNKPINVSSKTALDLTTEVDLARQKFKAQQTATDDQEEALKAARSETKKRRYRDDDSQDSSFLALQRKASQYKDVKRGKIESEVLLPDVANSDSDRSSSSESDDDNNRLVEVESEDGRVILVRASEYKYRQRPPSQLLKGDIIQRGAFELDSEHAKQVREDEGKDEHYDANWEVRDRGVGFFKFSQDEQKRKEQIESLRSMRQQTRQSVDRLAELKKKREARLQQRWEDVEAQRQKTRERMQRIGQAFEG